MSGMEEGQILSDQMQQAPMDQQAQPIAPMAESQPQAQMPAQQMPQMPQQPQTPPQDLPRVEGNTVYVTGQRRKPIISADLKQEDQGFNNDIIQGHIKPETYQSLFAKKDTLGKIGTIFGLMVGGAGAGLSHQPNALLEMMNREITNDLEAQKVNMQNKFSFARLNLDQQMNIAQIDRLKKEGVLTEAQANLAKKEAEIKGYSLAHMQMNRAALHNLVQQVNKLPVGSEARARAEKMLAFVSQGVQNENFNLADRAEAAGALANVAFGAGKESGNEAEKDFQQRQNALRLAGMGQIADDNERKHLPIPGIKGQASMPLDPATREQIEAGAQFHNKMQRFIDWTKDHSGDLSPSERNAGIAMAAELQGAYRLATKGGVYKEGEQNFISKLIDSTPTKFFNSIRVVPSLEVLLDENKKKVDEIAKARGFSGFDPPKPEKQSKKDEKKTEKSGPKEGDVSKSKSGKDIIYKNGKWVYK